MGLLKLSKVLVSDKIAPDCLEVFEGSGVEVTYRPGLSKDELLEAIPKYNGIIVRSATKLTADVIKAASNLEIIGRAGTGTDNIDIAAASEAGVVVMNTPGGNTKSAAEHTCALILAMCRNLPNRHAQLKAGQWNRVNGIELEGKTIGIVGLGRIGMIVAHRMQAFGMRTIGYDPCVPASVAAEKHVESMDLETMWPQCDFITVHVPLIPSTKYMINADVLKKCKKGVRIVNCARGGIIEESALLESLKSGDVACAALDVFEKEPPSADHPLIQHPNLIITPHLGASTAEAQTRVAREIAEQFLELRDGKSTFGCLNAPLLRGALAESEKAALASNLGGVLSALEPDTKLITVTADNGTFFPQAVTAGFLNGKGMCEANLININKAASDNGVSFQFHEGNDGTLQIGSNDTTLVAKTGNLVRINDTPCNIPLTGKVTVMSSQPETDELVSLSRNPAVSGMFFVKDIAFVAYLEGKEAADLGVKGVTLHFK